MGYDWILVFRPAALAFLNGQNPYLMVPLWSEGHFFNPPWLLVFIAPLALLPPFWGAAILDVISLSGLVALCHRTGKTWVSIPLALSFPMLVLLWMANVDGFSLWGLALEGPWGLLLLSTKPQVAGLVGLIWAVRAWRAGGWRKVVVLLAPAITVAAVFLAIYPRWPALLLSATHNDSAAAVTAFPWLVPFGVAAFLAALKYDRVEWAAVATVLVSPYARVQSLIGVLALLTVQYPLEGMAAIVVSWLIPFLL